MTQTTEQIPAPIWAIAAASLGVAAAAALFVSPETVTGILAGGAWNVANLWCLTRLLHVLVTPQPSRGRALGWLLIKFPLLYLLVFLVLRVPSVSLAGFGIGFTVVLLVAIGWFALQAQRMMAGSHGR